MQRWQDPFYCIQPGKPEDLGADFMEINILVGGFEEASEQTKYLQNLIYDLIIICSRYAKIENAHLNKLLIADKNNFANAVAKMDAGALFTNTEDYVAFGKTFAKREDDETLNTSIVLRAEVIDAVLLELEVQRQIDDWNSSAQHMLYLICHELGHCVDYRLRKNLQHSPLISEDNLFKVRQVADYYSCILLSEFAACVHAANGMTTDTFQFDNDSTLSTVQSMISKVQSEAKAYNNDPSLLLKLAFSASGTFWLALIQYTKLFGSQVGNQQLANCDVKYWENANSKTFAIFTELKKFLDDLWNQYPDWNTSTIQSLTELWHALSISNGFEFVESVEGDAIYWDISLFLET
jgi:hypothetical protein